MVVFSLLPAVCAASSASCMLRRPLQIADRIAVLGDGKVIEVSQRCAADKPNSYVSFGLGSM
jgi:hypothetical protein